MRTLKNLVLDLNFGLGFVMQKNSFFWGCLDILQSGIKGSRAGIAARTPEDGSAGGDLVEGVGGQTHLLGGGSPLEPFIGCHGGK